MASFIESSFDHEAGDEVLIDGVVWILCARPENWYECIGPHPTESPANHPKDYYCNTSEDCRCPPGFFWWIAYKEHDIGSIQAFDMNEVEWRPATVIDRLAALVEDMNE